MRIASDITSRASNEWQPAQQPFSQMPSPQQVDHKAQSKASKQGRPTIQQPIAAPTAKLVT
jgi:hypothetical protein